MEGSMECSMECSMAPSTPYPRYWIAACRERRMTFDGMFDGMFDGRVDGMFDGMFDGTVDAVPPVLDRGLPRAPDDIVRDDGVHGAEPSLVAEPAEQHAVVAILDRVACYNVR